MVRVSCVSFLARRSFGSSAWLIWFFLVEFSIKQKQLLELLRTRIRKLVFLATLVLATLVLVVVFYSMKDILSIKDILMITRLAPRSQDCYTFLLVFSYCLSWYSHFLLHWTDFVGYIENAKALFEKTKWFIGIKEWVKVHAFNIWRLVRITENVIFKNKINIVDFWVQIIVQNGQSQFW